MKYHFNKITSNIKLEDYQIKGRDFILNNKSSFISLNMGGGKTAMTLSALEKLNNTTLLISFPNILNSWNYEINKFNFNLSMLIIEGNKKQREEQIKLFDSDIDNILSVSIYNIKWLLDYLSNNKIHFDNLIIDESSAFKNYSSVRFKLLKKYLKDNPIDRKILLTGTPNPNSYQDLWSQIYLLDNGNRLGKNITAFRNNYMRKHPYIDNVYITIDGKDEEVLNKIKDLAYNYEIKDKHIINYKYIKHSVNKNSTKFINYMREQYLIDEELLNKCNKDININLNDKDMLINSGGVLYNKLLQAYSGVLYIGEDKFNVNIHLDRIKLLKELLESYQDENFIIVYAYKNQRDLIIQHIKNITLYNKKDSKNIIDSWNSKKIKYLLVHHGNISHGLNMQYGGNNIIYFSPIDNLENYLQLNRRLARGKDKKIVNIFHLYSSSREKEVYKALENKKFNLDKMLKGFIK